MSNSAKKTFGKYETISHLGSGAMGVVWRAQDPVLGRTVAIKTISAALGTDTDIKERFLREARAAAQLNHPNIITVFDFGQADNDLYMAMELLEGKDLKDLITDANLTLDQKLNIMEQVSDGLAYAHGRSVVHRDLKPGNIHVQPNGQVKILDFGLAKLGSSDLTKTGAVMGTPNYMSPEQVMGDRVDARSDVFSAGAVFYELLTNHKPFDAGSIHATLYHVIHVEPPPPRQWDPSLPEGLASIIQNAMAKQVANRYPDARALHDAIRAFRYGVEPEVVEYEDAAGLVAAPGPESSSPDATTHLGSADVPSSAGPSGSGSHPPTANASGVRLPKPAPFRSYGRTGSGGGSGSAPPSGGVSSMPPGAGPAVPASIPPTRFLAPGGGKPWPLIIGGVGVLLLALGLGVWALNRKPADDAGRTTLDALAANLVESQLDLARRALGDKNYKEAIEQADRVLKLDAENAEAKKLRGDADAAIKDLESWVGVARAAVARGASDQAAAALDRVMQHDPANPVVAELSSQLNDVYSARATEARADMEKTKAQAENQVGAVQDAAFGEAEELATAAAQSFEAEEFTTAAKTFLQARDAFERARRSAKSGKPSGQPSVTTEEALPDAPAGRPVTGAATPAVPSATARAPQATPSATARAAATPAAALARELELETGPTSVQGLTPAEFEGRFEFEITPGPLRIGSPFRIRVFLRNEGKKDVKLARFEVQITRNGDGSSQAVKLAKDDVKAGQRTMIAVVPPEGAGTSLMLAAGTTSWSVEVEAVSRKGEQFRGTLTMR